MKKSTASIRRTPARGAIVLAALALCAAGSAFAQSKEVVTQDPGGTYGEALRKLVYDPFTKDTGIKVLTVQEARGGPRVKAQVSRSRRARPGRP